ncbi:transmembrane amino acid transporter protein-domain-containing protein [Paraphysoderma sedebokerense]|nr:transmembrane amino acid transporter protein-domain-containing protein [Paraphysoderma sedebokerense]
MNSNQEKPADDTDELLKFSTQFDETADVQPHPSSHSYSPNSATLARSYNSYHSVPSSLNSKGSSSTVIPVAADITRRNSYVSNKSDRISPVPLSDEHTPLLSSAASIHSTSSSYYSRIRENHSPLRNRSHSSSHAPVPQKPVHSHFQPHGTTFSQALFNSVNVLVGIGILALPFAFRITGIVLGLTLMLLCAAITNYTAKILGRLLALSPRLRTYSDIGDAAFGLRGRVVISVVFMTELFAASVALIILMADSIVAIWEDVDVIKVKLLAFAIVTPTLWLRSFKMLSYCSLMGIFSIFFMLFIIIYDGLYKQEHPGSLRDPSPTLQFDVPDWYSVPLSFGLLMAGYAGHSIFPSICTDMQDRSQYPRLVNVTYVITCIIYLTVSLTGYIMFGSDAMQEITQNLAAIKSYSQVLNKICVFLIIVNPFSKYALTVTPVTIGFEQYLAEKFYGFRFEILRIGLRTFVSVLILIVAIVWPGFHQVMALLGSFFSFFVSGIFPLVCFLKLLGGRGRNGQPGIGRVERWIVWGLIALCTVFSLLGTVWSFLPLH